MALADTSGTVVERFKYDPYGRSTVLDGNFALDSDGVSDYDWEYRFTSRQRDAETGLHYFRARYYHDGLGRFIGRDPLTYVDGGSLYAGYFVPDGVDPWELEDAFEACKPKVYLINPFTWPVIRGFTWWLAGYEYDPSKNFNVHFVEEDKYGLPVDGSGFGASSLGTRNGQSYSQAGKTAAGMVQHIGEEGGAEIAAAAAAATFAGLLDDIAKNPGNWETTGSFTGPSTRRGGRVSGRNIQTVVRNKKTGHTMVRHTLYDDAGKVVEEHYRPMYKPRDCDLP